MRAADLAFTTCAALWPGVAAAASCSIDAFQNVLPSNAVILSAVPVANGSSYGEGAADIAYPTNPTNLPAACAMIVNVTTSPQSNFRFGIFLPTQWNSRFLAVGNGGFAGGINWLDMGSGIQYGFAVVSTDTGHNSTLGDLTWALNNSDRKDDFGYRAIHGSVVLGKQLTEAYYGQNISYSYYSGASTGGRQGLREAQYDAESFDGLLVGAPAWWTSHLQTWTTRIGSLNLPVGDAKRIDPTLFPVVGAEVTKQCDAVDGVTDGIVSAPDLCNFTANALLCGSATANSSTCLTSAQVQTVNNFYADYYAEGKFAFPGLDLGSESQWPVLLGGSTPATLGDGYIQNFLLNDPTWTWPNFTDSIVWKADAEDPGNATAQYYDMTAVKEHGSKILMYHGTADGLIATRSSNVFYERVAEAMGGYDGLKSWFRFFLVPGMQHVSGTAVDAPWYFAGANQQGVIGTDVYSTPGFEDAQHDALLALMNWVENGEAVDQIVATAWNQYLDPSSGVLRQRPLCPWPQRSVYGGSGDVNAAESWTCS